MFRIPYVPDVVITDLVGEVQLDEDKRPITMGHRKFMLQRMADPKFTQGKEGMEGSFFVQECRQQLLSQDEAEVKTRGYWLVENDQGKAIKEVILHPTVPQGQQGSGYIPTIQHSLVPFGMSAKNMKDDAEEKKKEADGVPAAPLPS
jgi:hypothetical protein